MLILQLTRVVNTENPSITDEELESYYRFVPEEISKLYLPAISDTVKNNMNEEYLNNHMSEFFKLWINVGKKNPGTYLEAFLALTEGYFYPCVTGVSTWGFVCEWSKLDNVLNIKSHSLIPVLHNYMLDVSFNFYKDGFI